MWTPVDLSGPTNGLIILSSVSLAIIQYFYTDLKSRFVEAQTRVKETRESKPHATDQDISKRYDTIRATKLWTVRNELSGLFIVLFGCSLVKIFDMEDLYRNGQYHWQEYTFFALIALSVAFSILLAWTAGSLKLLGRRVRKVEALVDGCCDQIEAVARTLDGMRGKHPDH
jgi:hypothetical protein